MERRKIARRIELERVEIVGVQLADTVATGKTNSHRPRYRFARPNATMHRDPDRGTYMINHLLPIEVKVVL